MTPLSKPMWLVATLLLTGCTLQASRTPTPELPQQFTRIDPAATANWPGSDWYHGFGSAELDGLIEQAMRNNLDLQGAHWRIQQAGKKEQRAGAGLLPSVDFLGNVNRFSGHSSQG